MLAFLLAALFLAPPTPRDLCQAPFRTPDRFCTMIFFDPGSAEIAPSAWPILDTVVGEVEDNDGAKIVLAGHTDATLDPGSATALSKHSAESVRDYLIQHGVAAEKISVEAYGSANPREPGTRGKAQPGNRRVEIWVI